MQISINVSGFGAARSFLGNIAAAAVRAGGPVVSLSSPLPYAYGIETGRHRGGRLARARGGAFMFRDGIRAMQARTPGTLAAAVLRGPAAVDAAKRSLNAQAIEEVRKRTPVRSGALRASVHESGRP
jgi:hypothetical protein